MVPKVNSGANVYGVLQYNRIKVEAGEGRILYMQGIPERSDGRFSIEECAEAFGYYTALNPRVRKPVVHFSLNGSDRDSDLAEHVGICLCQIDHGLRAEDDGKPSESDLYQNHEAAGKRSHSDCKRK